MPKRERVRTVTELRAEIPADAADRPWYWLDAITASEADALARGEVPDRIKAMVQSMQEPSAVRATIS